MDLDGRELRGVACLVGREPVDHSTILPSHHVKLPLGARLADGIARPGGFFVPEGDHAVCLLDDDRVACVSPDVLRWDTADGTRYVDGRRCVPALAEYVSRLLRARMEVTT